MRARRRSILRFAWAAGLANCLAAVPGVAIAQSNGPQAPTSSPVPPPPPADDVQVRPTTTPTQADTPPTASTGASHAPPGSSAFIDWTPGHNTPRTTPRSPGTANLLQSASSDGARAAVRNDASTLIPAVTTNRDVEQIGRATIDYWAEQLSESHRTFVPGSYDYFRAARTRARDVWHPPRAAEPTFGDALAGTFVSPTDRAVEAWTRSLGPLATGVAHAAITALNNAHPNSPVLEPAPTMSARGRAMARTTRAVVEVEQREDGTIARVRVAHSTGGDAFNETAMRAVEQSVADAPRPAMPGGWRSRWLFEQSVWRDPLIGLAAGPPGSGLPAAVTANAEVETDGEPGETRVHAPGMIQTSRRVVVLSSERIVPAARARTGSPTANAPQPARTPPP